MKINTENWHEFKLCDLFELKKGKRLTKEDMEDGPYNFIGAIDSNNGVREKINCPQSKLFLPNCITVNYNGSVGESFYQSEPFWASDDVNVLYLKSKWILNKFTALFMITIIKHNKYRFDYGRKWTMEKMKESTIYLPVTSKGEPDWTYMENYIKSLHYKHITTNVITSNIELKTNNWLEYPITDYFMVKAGKYHNSDEYEKGSTPYVSASNLNNGIKEFISIQPEFKGNCIITGKVGCTAFYQPDDFCATSDVNILTPKFKMSKYIGLFITCVINKNENYRWTYGRQCRVNDTEKIKIKLPSTPNGIPDWDFMEKYIKSLPFSDRII